MSNPFDGIGGGGGGGFNATSMQAAQAKSDAKAQAKLDLAAAEADAQLLLDELNAADASEGGKYKTYRLPSPYAPGEGPADPVKGVAQPAGYNDSLYNAMDGNFKPVDLTNLKDSTLQSSHTVDFAQKIKDANKHGQ